MSDDEKKGRVKLWIGLLSILAVIVLAAWLGTR